MWKFSKWNRKNVVIYILFCAIANLILLLEPLLFSKFINNLQNNWLTNENIWDLTWILFLMLSLVFVFWLFHWISRVLENKNAFIVNINYKAYLFEKTLNYNLSWHDDRQSWETIDKIDKATRWLKEFSSNSFQIIEIIVRAVWTIFALIYFWFWMSIIVLLVIIISLYIIFLFDKKLIPQYDSINIFENKISAKIYDSLSNITSIIILNIKKLVLKDVKKSFHLPQKVYYKNIVLNEIKWFVWNVLLRCVTVFPIIYYVWYHYTTTNAIQIWDVSALYLYLNNLSLVFFWFSWLYWQIIVQKSYLENAWDIENGRIENIENMKNAVWKFRWLEIKNLYFSYKENDPTIKNINLNIKSWEKIALIWASGSWKTTLLKIMHSLLPFSKWELVVNDKVYNDFTQIDLKTTLVPQEPELFTATILENITFWLDYTVEKVKYFTDLACFTEVIEKLPNWFESTVNEKWVNLSWWQKQRLALARALLFAMNKEIILLDESTSSVDPENESKIYENIMKNFNEKTIISSIHKMNLLKFFDRIIMFDNWIIVDYGSFEYLLKNNKKFSRLWKDFIDKEK